jgi:hypothetical protein
MTWDEFKAIVRIHLVTHNRRQGIQTYIDTLIKAGSADIQRTVEAYQQPHVETLGPVTLVEDGFASTGTMVAGKILRTRIVVYDTALAAVVPDEYLALEQISWTQYQRMRAGLRIYGDAVIAINPHNATFAVVPQITAEMRLIIEWQGVKTDFAGSGTVPFDEAFAETVANYVLGHLTRTVDRDLAMAQSYMQSYVRGKRILLSEARYKTTVLEPLGDSNWGQVEEDEDGFSDDFSSGF